MTDYLALAQARASQPEEQEQSNPYLPLAREQQSLQQNQVRTVLEIALKDNPDIAAERQRIAQQSGVPLRIVERNLDEIRVKEQARMVDLARMAQESPVLYRQLTDPTFTTTSVDDLDTLKNLERSIGRGVAYVMGADGKGGLPKDLTGAATTVGLGATVGIGKMVFDAAAVVNDLIGWDTGAANMRTAAKRAGDSMRELGLEGGTSTRDAVKSGLQSAGTNLAILPLGLTRGLYSTATQAASTVAGVMAAGVGTDAFNRAREQGKNELQAGIYAIPEAAFEYVFERIPASKLFGDIAANTGLMKTLGKQALSEGWTEQVTTLAQDFNEWMNLNPDKTLGEFIAERPEAAYQTFVATLVGVGVQTSTIKGINKIVQKASDRQLQFEQDAFNERLKLAGQSMLRMRSPEQFRNHIQQVVDENPEAKAEVFIDAEVLNQMPPELLAQLPESVREQIPAALETRSVVAMPMADVLTIAPGTPLEQALNDNVRLTPDSPSKAEAQLVSEMLQRDAERVLAQAADQDAWAASAETVKTTILEQLNTAGRFTPDVNEAYATLQMNFFSTMAARVGLTPEEMYQRYALKASAAQQGQGNVLNAQNKKPGEIEVEGYHYSKAARPTISTRYYGTGLQGSGRETYLNATDRRLRNRAYFYVDKGTGVNPESGVGGIAQRANLSNIYDSDADPLKLKGGNQLAFESAVLDAGFSGYLARMDGTQSGQVILLGDQAVAAEVLGPMGRIQAGQRVAALPQQAPQWRTQASGTPEQLQARLERMQSNPSWANYDLRIQGNELQVREKGGVFNQSLSSRLPSAVKATEDPLAEVLNITYDVVLSDTKTLAKNVAALQELPNMRKLTGKGARDPVRNVEAFIDHVANNLLWLHDHMPAEMRARAELWYDGGRKTVETWADRYGISEMQGVAAIAVLSPQNGWFANVSQAERIADMVFGLRDFTWDDAMTAEAERIAGAGGLDAKMQAAVGKTLGELLATPDIAARWARVYDQTYNNRAYKVLTPEGGAADYVKTAAGADATMMWKSYSTIAKAISVFTDGRAENVHYQIGKEHKVRNFYNNIFDPNSPLGYATIDTHAVAAGLLRPLASSDIEVAQAFGGGGSASSSLTGLNGTYPIYLEAYRRAAEARGLQPRQMQSITWEAVRGLFEATAKRGMKAPANAIWERYKNGDIDQAQAQQEILALAGDITPPAWTEVPFTDTVTRTYEGPAQAAIDARGPAGQTETPPANVAFEVAPDPNNAELTAEWNALPPAERLAISQRVASQIVPKVLTELGTGGDFVMQIGGYLGATNPSMTLQLERPELALTAAKMLGFALSQDSMMVTSETPFVGSEPVGVITLALPEGYGAGEVEALYTRLWQLKGDQGQELVGGHTTADDKMVILNYSGLDDVDLAERINAHLGGEFAVDIGTVYSAFPSKKDYGYGSDGQEGATPAQQSPAQRRPRDLRNEATQALRTELAARQNGGTYAQAGDVNARPESTGDRGGRYSSGSLAPLEGAPVVAGATGPDARLVAVAEQYAADNGIDLKRQAEFVEVDPERAKRIADAYAAMPHAPQDPAVKEAYENLIRQTVAQYRALEAAGYKFYMVDETNDPYAGNPWNAMRDLRANQTMGVFATEAGFGTNADFDPTDNPLLADTGIRWPYGSLDGELKRVLANDLFRAVHDAFGHGLEGAGFRARGEENAWQAHARLFTGSAVGAITSETRGQNSWLNFGPNGEANQTAKVEDTVFADQKTGLMPEWTWTEGRAADMQSEVLEQGGPLLAPNGQPSNLPPNLYAMVRTPEFKAWFGDWENDPTNASKAVDENGEPKLYYHGSKNAGFTEFETNGKGKTRGTGAFFADNFSMAKGYSGSSADAPIYTPEQIFADPYVIDGLEIEKGVIVEVVVSSRGDKAWQWYADEEEALADLELEPGEELDVKPGYRAYRPGFGEETGTKEQILDYLDGMAAEAPGVYEVFLNVRDLVEIDWQGNNWDDGPKEKVWNILDEDGDIYDTAYSQEDAEAIIERNPNFTIEEDEQTIYEDTDDAARQGRDMGADGVHIKDVFDTGPEGYAEDGEVLIVYKPENIKEVRNEGTFDPTNPNILKQGPRGTFNPSQLLITLNENADLSTFLHESGHFFLEVLADLASQPNAPAQIAGDMAATLKWFGVPDLATWNSYTLDQKRPYHEHWAESFEQYLLEGKAPSAELQPLFRRFRSWLVNVYMSLTHFMRGRGLKVNDEIRQVFDRLVATDEQIAQAEETAGMLPDFDATNEAIEKLTARSLRDLKWAVNARNKKIRELQKQAATLRKDVEAEVTAEVNAMPEVRAKEAIDELRKSTPEYKAALAEWKAQRQAAADQATADITANLLVTEGAGLDGLKKGQFLAKNKRRIANEAEGRALDWERQNPKPERTLVGGEADLAMVADQTGYSSVEDMLAAIDAFGRKADVIEGLTDQRMLERHGDLVDQRAIEDAATEAVHNDVRARALATELKAQADAMNPREQTGTSSNGRPVTVNALERAAKEFAKNLAARRRLKDLKSAAAQHRAAEARAGKAWQKATAEGKTQEAVQAKRDQLLNNQAVRALQEAQAEAKKIVEFFRKVTDGSNEKTVERGRDPDVVNAMRAILASYDVAPRLEKGALEYMETVARNDPAMHAALAPSVQAALNNAKPLSEMIMEELRGLNDELRAMWDLAKRSRQMEVDGNLLDIEEAADQLVARMGEIGIPDEIPGERQAINAAEERGIKLQFAKAILSRVEQWAERMDGAFGGPFLRLVFQPIKDAADRYRADRVRYRKQFTKLLEGIAPALPPGPIAAPELGYTFGAARDSGTAELLHAILHTGNDSNKRKLLLGRGWATENADGALDTAKWDAFMDRMHTEGKITKAHYDFAQGVWDLLEQMKPLAQETHRNVFGRYFAEVTANEVVTPFGTYRGGYVPAQTDSRLVTEAKIRELAEGENESMAYAFPSSPSGFTKSRVEYNKPLLLDIRALAQHMDKVLLFSHMQGAVTDVRRLLSSKNVSYALDRVQPGAYEGMLIPWLNRAAKQVVETPVMGDRKISRFLSGARSRAGMAMMFANLSNTAQQITGFSLAAVKVKPGLLLKAAAQAIANPLAMRKSVADTSAYMKDRMLNETAAMSDAVEDILVNPSVYEKAQTWTQRHAYFMQSAVDNFMSPIVWTAAYNQAVEQGESHDDAVRFADGTVRQTQGSTLPEDISRFESGPAYARLFTQFVGYFNMMANTNATAMKQIADEMGLKRGAGKLAYVALAGLLVPIWVAEAIAQAFRGGPEDDDDDGYLDDWLAAVFGLGTLKGLLAQVPIVGQAGQLVLNRFNDNPADDKFSLSPAVSLIESAVSSPSSVYKAIVDEGNAQKAVRDVAAAATLTTGLPFYAAARPIGYLAGVAQGKTQPTSGVDAVRGTVTGAVSPESRTP